MNQQDLEWWLASRGLQTGALRTKVAMRLQRLVQGYDAAAQADALQIFFQSNTFEQLLKWGENALHTEDVIGAPEVHSFATNWLDHSAAQRGAFQFYSGLDNTLHAPALHRLLEDARRQAKLNDIVHALLAVRFDFELMLQNQHGLDFQRFQAATQEVARLAPKQYSGQATEVRPPKPRDYDFTRVISIAQAQDLSKFDELEGFIDRMDAWAKLFKQALLAVGRIDIDVFHSLTDALVKLGNIAHEHLNAWRAAFLYILHRMRLPFDHGFTLHGLEQCYLGNVHGLSLVLSRAAARIMSANAYGYFKRILNYPFTALRTEVEPIHHLDLPIQALQDEIFRTVNQAAWDELFFPVDLAEVIERACATLQLTAQQAEIAYHSILIQYHLPEGVDLCTPLPISGDEGKAIPAFNQAVEGMLPGCNLMSFQRAYLD